MTHSLHGRSIHHYKEFGSEMKEVLFMEKERKEGNGEGMTGSIYICAFMFYLQIVT